LFTFDSQAGTVFGSDLGLGFQDRVLVALPQNRLSGIAYGIVPCIAHAALFVLDGPDFNAERQVAQKKKENILGLKMFWLGCFDGARVVQRVDRLSFDFTETVCGWGVWQSCAEDYKAGDCCGTELCFGETSSSCRVVASKTALASFGGDCGCHRGREEDTRNPLFVRHSGKTIKEQRKQTNKQKNSRVFTFSVATHS
jgi:hypothetical protein